MLGLGLAAWNYALWSERGEMVAQAKPSMEALSSMHLHQGQFQSTGWVNTASQPTLLHRRSAKRLTRVVGRTAYHSIARMHDGFSENCGVIPRWSGHAIFVRSLPLSEQFYLYSLYRGCINKTFIY
jgi:hypothetical protein